MANIGWIVISVGSATLMAFVGIIVFQRIFSGKRSESPLREERATSHELMILGSSSSTLGIVFGTNRLISYSFIGAGVLLSIIGAIKSRKKGQRSSLEAR